MMGDQPPAEGERRQPTSDRAPYETPEIAWEDDLGTRPGLVAACAKVSLANPVCATGDPSS
jgi:hypothetical protein